MATSTSFGA
jgi:hypothetical protein